MASDGTTLLDVRYGERLRGLRDARDMTQAELVSAMKGRGIAYMNPSTLSRIEAGTRPVRLSEAQVIGRIFNVSVEGMTSDFEALAYYEMQHRRAREAFVSYRSSATEVAKWKIKLEGHLEELRGMLAESKEDELTRVLQELIANVENYVAIDVVDEASSLEAEIRRTHVRQQGSRAGRFLNARR